MQNKQLEHSDFQSKQHKFPVSLLLNNIHSPLNVGGFFRLADALGIQKIILAGTTPIPPNTKIKKTARSTEKYVDHIYVKNALDYLHEIKKKNTQILSIEICNTSKDLASFHIDKSKEYCLVLGEENAGIDQNILDISDEILHIEMLGINSSMNVVSACAIASYTIINQFKK